MTLPSIAAPLAVAGIVAKATLLVAIGWSVTRLLRRSPAAARHRVWLVVIAGVLLVPALAYVVPVRLAVLPRMVAGSDATPRVHVRESPMVVSTPTTAIGTTSVDDVRTSGMPAYVNYGALAVALWLVVTMALLVWIAAGMLWVQRIVRRGRELHSTEWTDALADAAARLELAVRPRLIMSDQVEMAFAFGPLAPVIIVPVSAQEWSVDRRRTVLLHELAHIRRRDLIGHTIASVACAVYWFNPFVWTAARRLRVESELASDDVVLACGVRPSDYAQHLLDIVTSVGRRAPTVALAIARPNEFEGRLVAILDRESQPATLGRVRGRAIVGLLALVTLSIGAAVPVPRFAEIADRPVAQTATTPVPARDSVVRGQTVTPSLSQRVHQVMAPPTTDRAARRPDVAVATLLHYGTEGIINPMLMILHDADSLGLSGPQADSIATLNRVYLVRLNAIWASVRGGVSSADESSLMSTAGDASHESMRLLIGIAPDVLGLLTPEQRGKLSGRVLTYLDPARLHALGVGPLGGAFFPGGTMDGRGMRRRFDGK